MKKESVDSNPASETRLASGTLWERAISASAHALEIGALRPIDAVGELVEDGGIPFVVWRLTNTGVRLPGDPPPREKPAYSETAVNPFLPYDPDIFVADITGSHVCLLNKFNVLDNHLLIVTRKYERQTNWLTLADFEALWLCMLEFDGLAFYNGGKTAGASQCHKHLQYAPLTLGSDPDGIPVQPALDCASWQDGIGRTYVFQFRHAIGKMDLDETSPVAAAANYLLSLYWRLLEACHIERGGEVAQTRAYNLLATRRWMMIVPRSRESYAEVSVNALGFAGSLLARSDEQLQIIRETGPLSILAHVGVA